MKTLTAIICLLAALTAGAQLTNVNVGTASNAGNGDTTRVAFSKLNWDVDWLGQQLSNGVSAATASNVVSGIGITNAFITNAVVAGNGLGLTNLAATNLIDGPIPTGILTAGITNGAGHLLVVNADGLRHTTVDMSALTNGNPGQVSAQPTNANLTTLASNNGVNLTNLQPGNVVGGALTNGQGMVTMATNFIVVDSDNNQVAVISGNVNSGDNSVMLPYFVATGGAAHITSDDVWFNDDAAVYSPNVYEDPTWQAGGDRPTNLTSGAAIQLDEGLEDDPVGWGLMRLLPSCDGNQTNYLTLDNATTTVGGNLSVLEALSVGGGISGFGSGITGLNANNISSGTLSLARLPDVFTNGQSTAIRMRSTAALSLTNAAASQFAFFDAAHQLTNSSDGSSLTNIHLLKGISSTNLALAYSVNSDGSTNVTMNISSLPSSINGAGLTNVPFAGVVGAPSFLTTNGYGWDYYLGETPNFYSAQSLGWIGSTYMGATMIGPATNNSLSLRIPLPTTLFEHKTNLVAEWEIYITNNPSPGILLAPLISLGSYSNGSIVTVSQVWGPTNQLAAIGTATNRVMFWTTNSLAPFTAATATNMYCGYFGLECITNSQNFALKDCRIWTQ